jgi:hypothetical protein
MLAICASIGYGSGALLPFPYCLFYSRLFTIIIPAVRARRREVLGAVAMSRNGAARRSSSVAALQRSGAAVI